MYQGALAGDGKPRVVDGDLNTIMAGLACGEPNTISWDILRNHVTAFVSCPATFFGGAQQNSASPGGKAKGEPDPAAWLPIHYR